MRYTDAPHQELPPNFLDLSLSEQIDLYLEHYLPQLVQWLQEWLEVSETGLFKGKILFTRYEDLHDNPRQFCQKILQFYEIDPHYFTFIERQPHQGRLHFRKAQIDEWQEVYTHAQLEKVKKIVPQSLLERFDWSA